MRVALFHTVLNGRENAVRNHFSQILLVEDRVAQVEMVRRAFEANHRFHLAVALSQAEARVYLAETHVNLIISNLHLGTNLLLANGEESEVPLILMFDQIDEEAAVAAVTAGALDYQIESEETFHDLPRIAERALREWRYITGRHLAEEARRRSAQENAVMAEIGRVVNSSLEIEAVYEEIVRHVGTLIPFDRLSFNVIDRENETTTKTYVYGIDVPERPQGRSFPVKGGGKVDHAGVSTA